MGVLHDYVRHLPVLKDSPKAVPKMKKGNIPFHKADLAAIVLTYSSLLGAYILPAACSRVAFWLPQQ